MPDVIEQLKAEKISVDSVERVKQVKARLRLRDDEPMMDFIVEMERYLVSFKEVTEEVKSTASTTLEAHKAQSKEALDDTVRYVSDKLAQQLTRNLNQNQKLNRWRAFVQGGTIVMFTGCVGLSLGVAVHGHLPSYFPATATSDDLMVNFLMGALHAPTYISWTLALIGLSAGIFLERWTANEVEREEKKALKKADRDAKKERKYAQSNNV